MSLCFIGGGYGDGDIEEAHFVPVASNPVGMQKPSQN